MVSLSFEEIGFAQQARVCIAVLFVPPSQRNAGEPDRCRDALKKALAKRRTRRAERTLLKEPVEPPHQSRQHGSRLV